MKLGEIVSLLGGISCPPEAAEREIRGVASLSDATPLDISFLTSERYVDQFRTTRAAAVIVAKKLKLPEIAGDLVVLQVDDANLALAGVLDRFAPTPPAPPTGVDTSARVHSTVELGEGVAIGPFVCIGERSRIGARSTIHAGAFVGDDVVIGDDCQIFPNVVVRERITIGSRVIIHSCSAIGSDGFGFRWDGKRHVKMQHIGTVVIEDDVEIGSCACVDRAKVGETRVGRGTKIDNLVQIAHNCRVGPHCILAGQVALAGSAALGMGVVIGGATSVLEHATMGDGSICGGRSGVTEDVPPKTIVSGSPAGPHRQTLREIAALHRLPELLKEFQQLKNEVDSLKKQLDSK